MGPANRRKARNPVKSLAARTDLRETYSQAIASSEEETPSTPTRPRNTKQSHLAVEALAGLASKEDFCAVQLRKNSANLAPRTNQDMIPYKDGEAMLIQVKGRRFCQPRLIEPSHTSVNSGDAYVLVTGSDVFNWVGKFSNVIERNRSAEIAQSILQRKELGCKKARRVHTIEEERAFGASRAEKDFWAALGSSEPKPSPTGPPEEDEEYELQFNDCNLVWEVRIDSGVEELIPVESCWGCVPKYDALDHSKVLVIDFGSEGYVWNGKNAGFDLRKAGSNLAKQMWDSGYDYTGADTPNPLLGSSNFKGSRPSWCLLGKITHHMETVLFREKFQDWPDAAAVIRVKDDEEKILRAIDAMTGEIDVEAFDAHVMAEWKAENPDLQLEGSHLGRGRGYYDESERRQYEIETASLKVWHCNEYEIEELPAEWPAQFHSCDTYVVRWCYKVSLTGKNYT
jgi:supervillin